MSKRVSVAVIGAGIGKAHVAAYAALPDLFDVRYVCDLDFARATEAAGQVLGCQPVGDISQVLADPDTDLIDICLPPRLHAPTTLAALEAGKHVICEKPLASSLHEVREITALAREKERQVFPVFQYRYGSGYRAAHELKARGLLGRPHVGSLETHWQRGATYYDERWRGTWKGELGGVLVSHACHIHNLMTHLLGEVTEVAAFLDTRVNRIETEDCAALCMRTAEGALVTSSITLGAAGNSSRLRMCFEHVTVTSGTEPYQIGAGPWTFTAADPSKQAEIDLAVLAVPEIAPRFPGMFADVHDCLVGRKTPYLPNLQDSYHSIELITAIYASAREGKVVQLPLPLDHALASGWLPA